MYYTLYIDVFFLENLLTDYLLLTVTGRILKIRIPTVKRILAAGSGSLAVCLVYLAGGQDSITGKLILYGAIAPGMVFLSLPGSERPLYGKAVFLLYLNGFLLGGLFGWLRGAVAFPVYPFLFFTLVSYELLKLLQKDIFRQREQEQDIRSVTIRYGKNTCTVRALLDTGNRLTDPIFGKPVSILTENLKDRLLGGTEPVWYPIPYHSVGRKNGYLPAFYADELEVETEDGVKHRTEKPLLGVTKEPLSSTENYSMILHPALAESSARAGAEMRVGGTRFDANQSGNSKSGSVKADPELFDTFCGKEK